jgi:hypothetical protein
MLVVKIHPLLFAHDHDVKVVINPIMLHSALRRVLHAENRFWAFIEGGNQELVRQLGPLPLWRS